MTPVVVDFRAEVSREAFVVSLPAGISQEDRALAAADWSDRMLSETLSSRIFAGLIPQLLRAGGRGTLLAAAADMAREEIDHGLLCARVAAAFGAEARMEAPRSLAVLPAHEDATPIEGLLRNVISISCLSETVAVALLGSEREYLLPALRPVETKILGDEVGHARFGWTLLEDVPLDETLRRRLDRYLVAAFEALIQHQSGFLRRGPVSDAALSLGVADGEMGWEIFLETVNGVIIPGLEKAGLRAGPAFGEALGLVRAASAA